MGGIQRFTGQIEQLSRKRPALKSKRVTTAQAKEGCCEEEAKGTGSRAGGRAAVGFDETFFPVFRG